MRSQVRGTGGETQISLAKCDFIIPISNLYLILIIITRYYYLLLLLVTYYYLLLLIITTYWYLLLLITTYYYYLVLFIIIVSATSESGQGWLAASERAYSVA